MFPEASWCQEVLLLIGTNMLRVNCQVAPENMVRLVREADIVPELILGVSLDIWNELELGSVTEVETDSQITLPMGIRVLPSVTRVSSTGGHFASQVFSMKMGQIPEVSSSALHMVEEVGEPLWG